MPVRIDDSDRRQRGEGWPRATDERENKFHWENYLGKNKANSFYLNIFVEAF